MCECGCASQDYVEAFRVAGSRAVISYQIFPGCGDCDYGPGAAVSVFDSAKSEWIEGLEVQSIKPDEYGGNDGRGITIPVLDIEDLRAAAKDLWDSATIGPGENQYANLDDWLSDFGQQMLEEAVRRRRERWHEQREQAKARAKKPRT